MSLRALVSKYSRSEAVPDPAPKIPPGICVQDLQSYADEWFLHCQLQQNAKATVETRRGFLKNFFWFLHHRDFKTCGRAEVRQFIGYLRNGHEEPGGRWGNPRMIKALRPISVKDYYICLRVFFEWLVREEIIETSPMERIEAPQAREEVKQPLSPLQTQALLRAARASHKPRRNEAVLLMLFDSGVRASELVSLKVKDIDLKNGSFEVTGKGNKKRMCYLGKTTAKSLMAYLRKAKLPPDAPLFPGGQGGSRRGGDNLPMTRSGLLHLIKRIGRAAGVPVNVHQLRRTFATSMLHSGADICSVRDLLGHTNIQMTLKYLSVSQSHIESQHRQYSPGDNLK